MPEQPAPRIMLFSSDAPDGRIFSVEEAEARLEDGWSDTPVPPADDEGDALDVVEPDALALALAAFVAIEAPRKDDWLALATAMEAPTEVFGMSASDLKAHLGGIMDNARAPFIDGLLPWSYVDCADAIRAGIAPSDD